jgi:hypothetical protein
MRCKIFHFIPFRWAFTSFAILFSLFIEISLTPLPVSAQGQETVRVAVKTNVPLTHAMVDQLAQYGKVGHRMWGLNMVDMRVSPGALQNLTSLPMIQYVENESPVAAVPIEVEPVDFRREPASGTLI